VLLPPPMLARITPAFRALLSSFLAFEVHPSGGGCSQQLLCNAQLQRAMLAMAAETVLLCSGRLDALYPYAVEAGGATHLDALMVGAARKKARISCAHAHARACTHARTHARMHACTHARTHTHTHTHTHTLTHTHTHR